MNVSPCIHPSCDDGNGDKALTTQTMCDRCRRHYRREIDWLVIDYVTIKTALPRPVSRNSGSAGGKTTTRTFGHPAEWASDRCSEIAGMLNDAEHHLRSEMNSSPALYICPENVKVASAHRYLTDRWDEFCTFEAADEFADAIHETHKALRSALGLTRFAQRLPLPCPSCDLATLVRYVGKIECTSCPRVIREEDYPMLTRIAVDALIDAYDAMQVMQ